MQELLDGFVLSLSETGRKSRNTVMSYKRDVSHYITYLAGNGVSNIANTDRKTIITYLMFMKNIGKAASTVSRSLASLRSFYMYVIDSGVKMEDPTANLETPRAHTKEPGVLTTAEAELLLEAPDDTESKGCRDKAMLELLYATGIKVSELINLRLEDVNFEMSALYCRTASHERVVPVGRTAMNAVRKYAENVRPQLVLDSRIPYLFLNRNGMQLSRQGFWKILKHYGKNVGIEKDITPYTLRHTFAMHLLENDADLESIRKLLGYTDISAARVYERLLDERVKNVYENTFPRA